jgi:hypothetical protein
MYTCRRIPVIVMLVLGLMLFTRCGGPGATSPDPTLRVWVTGPVVVSPDREKVTFHVAASTRVHYDATKTDAFGSDRLWTTGQQAVRTPLSRTYEYDTFLGFELTFEAWSADDARFHDTATFTHEGYWR